MLFENKMGVLILMSCLGKLDYKLLNLLLERHSELLDLLSFFVCVHMEVTRLINKMQCVTS